MTALSRKLALVAASGVVISACTGLVGTVGLSGGPNATGDGGSRDGSIEGSANERRGAQARLVSCAPRRGHRRRQRHLHACFPAHVTVLTPNCGVSCDCSNDVGWAYKDIFVR